MIYNMICSSMRGENQIHAACTWRSWTRVSIMGTGFSTACHASRQGRQIRLLGFPSNVGAENIRRLHAWAQSLPDLEYNKGVVLSYLGAVMLMLLSALSISVNALILPELRSVTSHYLMSSYIITQIISSKNLNSAVKTLRSPHERFSEHHTRGTDCTCGTSITRSSLNGTGTSTT